MAEKKDAAPKFDVVELINHAPGVFGVQPEILAGALHGVFNPLTLAEAKAHLDKFLVKEVKA